MRRVLLILLCCLSALWYCWLNKSNEIEFRLESWIVKVYKAENRVVFFHDELNTIASLALKFNEERRIYSLTAEETGEIVTLTAVGEDTLSWSISAKDSSISMVCDHDLLSWDCTVPVSEKRHPLFYADSGMVKFVRTLTSRFSGSFTDLYDVNKKIAVRFEGTSGFRIYDQENEYMSGSVGKHSFQIFLRNNVCLEPIDSHPYRLNMSGWRIPPKDSVLLENSTKIFSKLSNIYGIQYIWLSADLELRAGERSVILNNPYHRELQNLFENIVEHRMKPVLRLSIDGRLADQPLTLENIFISLKRQGLTGVQICCSDSVKESSILAIAQNFFNRSYCRKGDDFILVTPVVPKKTEKRLYRLRCGEGAAGSTFLNIFNSGDGWRLEAVLSAAAFVGKEIQFDSSLQESELQAVKRLYQIFPNMSSRSISRRTGPDLKSEPFICTLKKSLQCDIVILFNPKEDESITSFSFEDDLQQTIDTGFLVFDYWRGQILGVYENEVDLAVAGRNVKMMIIKPFLKRPQFLSDSRHFASISVKDVVWDFEKKKLKGLSMVTSGGPYSLYFHIPSAWKEPLVYCEVEISYQKQTGNLLEVRFGSKLKKGKQISWTLDFNTD